MGRTFTPKYILRTTHQDGSKLEMAPSFVNSRAGPKLQAWCEKLCEVNPHVPPVVLAEVCTNDQLKKVVARWQRA